MKHHLNTLYVFTQGAYLRKESETVVVRIDKLPKIRLPLLNIGAIACFGRIGMSPQLMGHCGQNGIANCEQHIDLFVTRVSENMNSTYGRLRFLFRDLTPMTATEATTRRTSETASSTDMGVTV